MWTPPCFKAHSTRSSSSTPTTTESTHRKRLKRPNDTQPWPKKSKSARFTGRLAKPRSKLVSRRDQKRSTVRCFLRWILARQTTAILTRKRSLRPKLNLLPPFHRPMKSLASPMQCRVRRRGATSRRHFRRGRGPTRSPATSTRVKACSSAPSQKLLAS